MASEVNARVRAETVVVTFGDGNEPTDEHVVLVAQVARTQPNALDAVLRELTPTQRWELQRRAIDLMLVDRPNAEALRVLAVRQGEIAQELFGG
ncbi:MAG TPA: hypothetical protein VFE45_04440 [Coriobacteriia bacterium]|jgi:hypothetical protein|nr:hypothetical protein [Coriobacteriia bacterium]